MINSLPKCLHCDESYLTATIVFFPLPFPHGSPSSTHMQTGTHTNIHTHTHTHTHRTPIKSTVLTLSQMFVCLFHRKLAEVLSIENYHISLPEACVLDYYVAGFWYPFHYSIIPVIFLLNKNLTLQISTSFKTQY